MHQYKNKEWLYNKYINEKYTQESIGKLCNVCQDTIWKWLHKHNIHSRSFSEANHLAMANHCNLSCEAIEWINGELLGDGSIQSQSKYSARFTYGSKYKEYIEYVRDTLMSFGIEQAGKINKRKDKKLGNICYYYCSRCYPELLLIRNKWYPEGKKIIPRDIKLTSLVLRQHYIGDGCLNHTKYGKPSIKLCTYGYSIIDVEYFIKELIKLGIKTTRNIQNVVYISTYSTKEFLEYIGECPVKCYKYKWAY